LPRKRRPKPPPRPASIASAIPEQPPRWMAEAGTPGRKDSRRDASHVLAPYPTRPRVPGPPFPDCFEGGVFSRSQRQVRIRRTARPITSNDVTCCYVLARTARS
jgi:hypothetical protein